LTTVEETSRPCACASKAGFHHTDCPRCVTATPACPIPVARAPGLIFRMPVPPWVCASALGGQIHSSPSNPAKRLVIRMDFMFDTSFCGESRPAEPHAHSPALSHKRKPISAWRSSHSPRLIS